MLPNSVFCLQGSSLVPRSHLSLGPLVSLSSKLNTLMSQSLCSTDALNSNIRCAGCFFGGKKLSCEVLIGNLDKEDVRESIHLTDRETLDQNLAKTPLHLNQFEADGDGYTTFDELFSFLHRGSHHANSTAESAEALAWAGDVVKTMGYAQKVHDREEKAYYGMVDRTSSTDFSATANSYNRHLCPKPSSWLLAPRPLKSRPRARRVQRPRPVRVWLNIP